MLHRQRAGKKCDPKQRKAEPLRIDGLAQGFNAQRGGKQGQERPTKPAARGGKHQHRRGIDWRGRPRRIEVATPAIPENRRAAHVVIECAKDSAGRERVRSSRVCVAVGAGSRTPPPPAVLCGGGRPRTEPEGRWAVPRQTVGGL